MVVVQRLPQRFILFFPVMVITTINSSILIECPFYVSSSYQLIAMAPKLVPAIAAMQ